jgi:hypothetical protein
MSGPEHVIVASEYEAFQPAEARSCSKELKGKAGSIESQLRWERVYCRAPHCPQTVATANSSLKPIIKGA